MIYNALSTLEGELREFLKLKRGNLTDDPVALSSFLKPNGEVATKDKQISITLIRIEEDRINRTGQFYSKSGNSVQYRHAPVNLNLFLLFISNFDNYEESLKHISYVISFFQQKRVFNSQNTPKLDENAELLAELYSQTFEEQNHMWGLLGGRYLPSILYRFRMVVIDENQTRAVGQPAGEMGQDSGNA